MPNHKEKSDFSGKTFSLLSVLICHYSPSPGKTAGIKTVHSLPTLFVLLLISFYLTYFCVMCSGHY